MTNPRVTIAVPVLNRQAELRRALSSLAGQTASDFECIVVDDASTQAIRPIVEEFDNRFTYVRNTSNAGCTGARFAAYERMRGDYLAQLDSDNEFFPWALERACAWLEATPDVGGVAGLYVFPDGIRLRVPDGRYVVTPKDFCRQRLVGDCVGVVRRQVVQEWLRSPRYYNLDFALWFSYQLAHAQLYVDEPWGRYRIDSSDRITFTTDARRFADHLTFAEEHRPILGSTPCRPLDEYLLMAWFSLWRAGRRTDAAVLQSWMADRGLTPAAAIWRQVREAVSRRTLGARPRWLEV